MLCGPHQEADTLQQGKLTLGYGHYFAKFCHVIFSAVIAPPRSILMRENYVIQISARCTFWLAAMSLFRFLPFVTDLSAGVVNFFLRHILIEGL